MASTMDASSSPTPSRGLTAAEAAARLQADGANALPAEEGRSVGRIVVEVLREPMMALLVSGGIVYLALGNAQEAVILMVFACLSVTITVVQESRTERVLAALRDLTSPRALVIRDGVQRRIAGREVVRGDLVILAEGDRVPADAFLREAHDLQADESLLTGESVPVRKAVGTDAMRARSTRPGGDDLPVVFSGSLVVRGRGLAEVIATGARSEIGKIGQTLRRLETEPPRLKRQIGRIVQVFALVGGAICALVVVLYGVLRGGWLDAVLAGIAIGMSMLPEEFPLVLTVFMAMGAWRISRARVLTRRAAAIETLGSATVLCTDKTGTLTLNRMAIAELRLADGRRHSLRDSAEEIVPEPFLALLDTGILGSAVTVVDPMERAFHDLGRRHREAGGRIPAEAGTLVRAYGLRPELLAMSNVWRAGEDAAVVATKGAPEAIADLCHLDADTRGRLMREAEEMAAAGMRVLGVARGSFAAADWPESQHDFSFDFVGLVGLADPLRPGVPEAVARCRAAGIRVVMVTGDFPVTACAIAREAGLDADRVLTGEELDRLDAEELADRVRGVPVFARIMPHQKLRIVEALKAGGEVVAMTGDGVNDAPSLKAAHIGIAMGGRGTDVAREAAAIVLLDDDFGSIVKAVALGRRIYDNLRKAMGFIFAVHVPVAGLALLPLFLGFPLLLGPVHIAFLEMVIDPACSLVFEAETAEDDVMDRPPRTPQEPLFSGRMILWGLIQGAMTFTLVAGVFLGALKVGMPEDEVRALTFFALVFGVVGLIFVNRSFGASLIAAVTHRNPALLPMLAGVVTMLSITLAWPFARRLFHFGPLHADDLTVTVLAGVLVLVLLDAVKFAVRLANRLRPPLAPGA
jgi:Ca2+-transporting ATPase